MVAPRCSGVESHAGAILDGHLRAYRRGREEVALRAHGTVLYHDRLRSRHRHGGLVRVLALPAAGVGATLRYRYRAGVGGSSRIINVVLGDT